MTTNIGSIAIKTSGSTSSRDFSGTTANSDDLSLSFSNAGPVFMTINSNGDDIDWVMTIDDANTTRAYSIPLPTSAFAIEKNTHTGHGQDEFNQTYYIRLTGDHSEASHSIIAASTEGDDVTIGSKSNANYLFGGDGNDRLIGGDGMDMLYAGGGSNSLFGGLGDDFYRFTTVESGTHTIQDDGSGIRDRVQVNLSTTSGFNWEWLREGDDLIGFVKDNVGVVNIRIEDQYVSDRAIEQMQIFVPGSGSSYAGTNWVASNTESTAYAEAGSNENDLFDPGTLVGSEKIIYRLWSNGGDDRLVHSNQFSQKTFWKGGDGVDTVVYGGNHGDYSINVSGSTITLVGDHHSKATYFDDFRDVERFEFADVSVAFDISGNAGYVAKTLATVFGPEFLTNKVYAGIGLSLMDSGIAYDQLMELAVNLVYTDTESFVSSVISNSLGDDFIDSGIVETVIALVDRGQVSTTGLATLLAEINTEIDLVGLSQTGLEYL
jgi:Ca2+-binding RTX toxin-like protein